MVELIIKHAILDWNHLIVPKAKNPGDEPKYQATFMFPKNTPETQEFIKRYKKVFDEVSIEKYGKVLTFAGDKVLLRDGEIMAQSCTTDKRDYLSEYFILTSRNKDKPLCVNAKKELVVSEAESPFYRGCIVNAIVDIYAFTEKKTNTPGIYASLKNVMFYKDGQRIAGSGATAKLSDFDAFEEAEEDLI